MAALAAEIIACMIMQQADFKQMLKNKQIDKQAFLLFCQATSTLFFGCIQISQSGVFHYMILIVKNCACWNT